MEYSAQACRICLREPRVGKFKSILTKDERNISYLQKLKVIGGTEKQTNTVTSTMPDKICNACINKLNQSYNFCCSFRSRNASAYAMRGGNQRNSNTNPVQEKDALQNLILQPFKDCSLHSPAPTAKKEIGKSCSSAAAAAAPAVDLKLKTEHQCASTEKAAKVSIKPAERDPKKFRTKLVCEYCGKLFKRTHSIIRHKRAVHPKAN